MSIKFEKIEAGMTLYDVRKKSGMSRFRGSKSKWDVWPVFVQEVDAANMRVLASWNHNAATWVYANRATKWRAKKPTD